MPSTAGLVKQAYNICIVKQQAYNVCLVQQAYNVCLVQQAYNVSLVQQQAYNMYACCPLLFYSLFTPLPPPS